MANVALWQRDYVAGRPYETPEMKSRRLDRTLEAWLRRSSVGELMKFVAVVAAVVLVALAVLWVAVQVLSPV